MQNKGKIQGQIKSLTVDPDTGRIVFESTRRSLRDDLHNDKGQTYLEHKTYPDDEIPCDMLSLLMSLII